MELVLLSVKRRYAAALLGLCGCGAPAAPSDVTSTAAATPASARSADAPLTATAATVSARPDSAAAAPVSAVGSTGAPASSAAPASAAPSSSSSAAPVEWPSGPVPPKGTRILHIGDSMAAALGLELNRLFRADGLEPRLVYTTSSAIANWASGYKVQTLIAEVNPALVLVSLGANESQILDPTLRTGPVQRIVKALQGRPCVWVLPPLGPKGRPKLFDVITAAAAPCVALETDVLVAKLTRDVDGIHPLWSVRPTFARVARRWLYAQREPATPGFQLRTALAPFPTVDFTALPPWASSD